MIDYTRRIHRLLQIITLVQGDTTFTPARLTQELGLEERTFYRDIKVLRDAGVPIDFDKERNGYVISRDFFLRPTELSIEEALSLCLLAQQAQPAEQLPHTRHAARAIEKIRSNLPTAFRDELEQLIPHVEVALARSENEGASDVFAKIQHAITSRRSVKCGYQSLRGKDDAPEDAPDEAPDEAPDDAPDNKPDNTPDNTRAFRFDPYALYFGQRAWYVIGKRHSDGVLRTLKLSRFVECTPTNQPFAIPDDFSLETYFGQAWRMMRGEGRHKIELRFSAAFAETVADTWWHASQESEQHDDGSVTMYFEIDGLDEIVWWILSYGPHCTVIQPPELRDRVVNAARKMLESYAEK